MSSMRIGEVAAYLGVRASALRVWESAGLLIPKREPGHLHHYVTADNPGSGDEHPQGSLP